MLAEKLGDTLLVAKNLFSLQIGTVLTLNNFWVWSSVVLFTYICFLAGDLLIQKIGFKDVSTSRRAVYGISAGYGIFGLLGLILALLGLFNAWMLWVVVLAIFIASKFANSERPGFFSAEKTLKTRAGRAPYVVQNMQILPLLKFYRHKVFETLRSATGASREIFQQKNTRVEKTLVPRKFNFLTIILTIWLIADFLIVLVPVTGHDTLDYHLPIINTLIEDGGINFSQNNRVPIPIFGEIIYAVPMVMFHNFSEPYIFQAMQYIFFILFLILFYDLIAPRLKNKFLAILVPLMLMSITDFQREVMHGGYVDIMMYLYGFLGSLIILESIAKSFEAPEAKSSGGRTERDGASLQGFLSKEKPGSSGGLWLPELVLASIFFGVALGIKYNALFFIFISFLFLTAYYFYIKVPFRVILRNFLIAFLIMAAIAGVWYAKNAYLYGNPVYPMFSVPEADANVKTFVIPPSLPNYFSFPFFRFSSWFVSDRASSGDLVMLAFYLALYPLILLNLILKKKLAPLEAMLIIFFQIMLGLIFLSSHQVRFMLPAMIIVPPLLILLLDNIWEYIKIPQPAAVIVMSLFFAVMFFGSLHYFRNRYFYATGVYDVPKYILEIGGL